MGTDVARNPPPEPKSHELGLLREKCRQYVQSVAKAENRVTHRDDNNVDVTDASVPATSTLAQRLDKNDECAKLKHSLDALSLVFGEIDTLKVRQSNIENF